MDDLEPDYQGCIDIDSNEESGRGVIHAVSRSSDIAHSMIDIRLHIFPWIIDKQLLKLLNRAMPFFSQVSVLELIRDSSVEIRDAMSIVQMFERLAPDSLETLYTTNMPCDAFYNLLNVQRSITTWRQHRLGTADRDEPLPSEPQLPPFPQDLELPELLDTDIDLMRRMQSPQAVEHLKITYGSSCPDIQFLENQVIDCLGNCGATLTHLCYEVPDPVDEDPELEWQIYHATQSLHSISEAAPYLQVFCLYDGRWAAYGSPDKTTDVAHLCTALSSFRNLEVLAMEAITVSGERSLWEHLWNGRMSQQITALLFEACPSLRVICLPCHQDSRFLIRYNRKDRRGTDGRWTTWQRACRGGGTFFDLWDRDKDLRESRLDDPPDVKTDAGGITRCGVCGEAIYPKTSSEEEEMDVDYDISSIEAEVVNGDYFDYAMNLNSSE